MTKTSKRLKELEDTVNYLTSLISVTNTTLDTQRETIKDLRRRINELTKTSVDAQLDDFELDLDYVNDKVNGLDELVKKMSYTTDVLDASARRSSLLTSALVKLSDLDEQFKDYEGYKSYYKDAVRNNVDDNHILTEEEFICLRDTLNIYSIKTSTAYKTNDNR